MFIHLPLIHFALPPRLLHVLLFLLQFDWFDLIWLAYFLSRDYPSYKFTRFFIYFLFLSDEGTMLETLDYTIRIGAVHRPFHYLINTFINTINALNAYYCHTPHPIYWSRITWIEYTWRFAFNNKQHKSECKHMTSYIFAYLENRWL